MLSSMVGHKLFITKGRSRSEHAFTVGISNSDVWLQKSRIDYLMDGGMLVHIRTCQVPPQLDPSPAPPGRHGLNGPSPKLPLQQLQLVSGSLSLASPIPSNTRFAMSHSHTHEGASHSHSHDGGFNAQEHGHSHEILDGPGSYVGREMPITEGRDWSERAFTVGIGGFVDLLHPFHLVPIPSR